MTLTRTSNLDHRIGSGQIGKHLIFQVEAPRGTPTSEIITFLRGRGHAIHEGDDVFVLNLGAYGMAEGQPRRDLSPTLLTEEVRANASAAGQWPKTCTGFTFHLDRPSTLQ